MPGSINVSALGIGFKKIYVPTGSVGYKCNNNPADVLLIQYLLKKIYEKESVRPLGPPLALDGQFGPKTHYWLLFFREQLRMTGAQLKDFNIEGGGFSLSGLNTYQKNITALAEVYRQYYPTGLETFPTHPDMPVLLKKALEGN